METLPFNPLRTSIERLLMTYKLDESLAPAMVRPARTTPSMHSSTLNTTCDAAQGQWMQVMPKRDCIVVEHCTPENVVWKNVYDLPPIALSVHDDTEYEMQLPFPANSVVVSMTITLIDRGVAKRQQKWLIGSQKEEFHPRSSHLTADRGTGRFKYTFKCKTDASRESMTVKVETTEVQSIENPMRHRVAAPPPAWLATEPATAPATATAPAPAPAPPAAPAAQMEITPEVPSAGCHAILMEAEENASISELLCEALSEKLIVMQNSPLQQGEGIPCMLALGTLLQAVGENRYRTSGMLYDPDVADEPKVGVKTEDWTGEEWFLKHCKYRLGDIVKHGEALWIIVACIHEEVSPDKGASADYVCALYYEEGPWGEHDKYATGPGQLIIGEFDDSDLDRVEDKRVLLPNGELENRGTASKVSLADVRLTPARDIMRLLPDSKATEERPAKVQKVGQSRVYNPQCIAKDVPNYSGSKANLKWDHYEVYSCGHEGSLSIFVCNNADVYKSTMRCYVLKADWLKLDWETWKPYKAAHAIAATAKLKNIARSKKDRSLSQNVPPAGKL